jgi:site-specific DNA-cytosine methylase
MLYGSGKEVIELKVLVACEFSQVVTKAFRDKGHEAYSCDLLPTEGNPDWHIQDDILKHLEDGWDMMIAHPPCTYLSYAATKSWNDDGRVWKRLDALYFFAQLWVAPIKKICIENPMGCASPTITKYTQVIQPYYWGDAESKRTCLWLKNLPKLTYNPEAPLFNDSTCVKPKVYGYYKRGKKKGKPIYGNDYLKFSEDRGLIRSIFWKGIANAMAEQWGSQE